MLCSLTCWKACTPTSTLLCSGRVQVPFLHYKTCSKVTSLQSTWTVWWRNNRTAAGLLCQLGLTVARLASHTCEGHTPERCHRRTASPVVADVYCCLIIDCAAMLSSPAQPPVLLQRHSKLPGLLSTASGVLNLLPPWLPVHVSLERLGFVRGSRIVPITCSANRITVALHTQSHLLSNLVRSKLPSIFCIHTDYSVKESFHQVAHPLVSPFSGCSSTPSSDQQGFLQGVSRIQHEQDKAEHSQTHSVLHCGHALGAFPTAGRCICCLSTPCKSLPLLGRMQQQKLQARAAIWLFLCSMHCDSFSCTLLLNRLFIQLMV